MMDELAEVLGLIDLAGSACCLGVLDGCLHASEVTETGRARELDPRLMSRGPEMSDEASCLGEGGAVMCESAAATT